MWSHWWLIHPCISPCLSCKLLWQDVISAWNLSWGTNSLYAMQHSPSFSFAIVRCLRNSDFFSSSGLVALGMQGTQNVTLGYLRLSGEFKYNCGNLVSWDLEGQAVAFFMMWSIQVGTGGGCLWGERLGYEPTRGNVGFRYCDQK